MGDLDLQEWLQIPQHYADILSNENVIRVIRSDPQLRTVFPKAAGKYFIALHLLVSGFDVRWLARSHDPQWTMCLRADKGAARRGKAAVRRAVASAICALGSECALSDILVHRRRQMYDVVFMHEGGLSGMVSFRQGKATYQIDGPHV